jgi:hypothetical protein
MDVPHSSTRRSCVLQRSRLGRLRLFRGIRPEAVDEAGEHHHRDGDDGRVDDSAFEGRESATVRARVYRDPERGRDANDDGGSQNDAEPTEYLVGQCLLLDGSRDEERDKYLGRLRRPLSGARVGGDDGG